MHSTNFKYIPELDSFRAFACISVILFHSNSVTRLIEQNKFTLFSGGALGVDMFFVLSGYLITKILIKEMIQFGTISKKTFYIKRLLRLYPPLLIAITIFLVPYLFYNKGEALSNMFFVLTYTTDVVKLFQFFIPSLQYPLLFSHTWSLAIEEQFYLFYPFLFIGIYHFYKKRQRGSLMDTFPYFNFLFLLLLILSFIFLGAWYYKFFLWRFFQIFSGAYFAVLFSEKFADFHIESSSKAKLNLQVRELFLRKEIFIFSAVLIVFFLNFNSYLPYGMHHYFIAIASGIVIVNLVENNDNKSHGDSFLTNKYLVYIGKISYGLYLYHAPIYHFQDMIIPVKDSWFRSLASDLLIIAIAFIISFLSYELIEKKILRYKKLLNRSPSLS